MRARTSGPLTPTNARRDRTEADIEEPASVRRSLVILALGHGARNHFDFTRIDSQHLVVHAHCLARGLGVGKKEFVGAGLDQYVFERGIENVRPVLRTFVVSATTLIPGTSTSIFTSFSRSFLTRGSPPLSRIELTPILEVIVDDPGDLLEGEDVGLVEPHRGGGHAKVASEVAAVGNRETELSSVAAEGVDESSVIKSQGSRGQVRRLGGNAYPAT